MSDESLEGIRQPVSPEFILGPAIWRIHVPSVSYKTFSAAQKLVGRQLKQKMRRNLMPLLIISWLIVFFGAFALTIFYKPIDLMPVIAMPLCLVILFVLYTTMYQSALYRRVYASGVYDNFTLSVGEKGILVESQDYMQFFSWRMIESILASERDFLIMTRSYLLIIVPDGGLRQVSDQDAMLAFVEGKIASVTEIRSPSPSEEG